ncbi:type IV pilus biogenesis/stability protein PilW [Shewanella submarina]|uniref:Type IV pilus biogenesis/stability protein PilW n=1 Tax=Shewanella submarina TaxID=2016376 RepID=A0ABV7GE53_9GAMM|nr:type IV pilus biogenesis/stability protein PilW [Shewanella submarina]MCL1037848.1 type IV pilus biogenesis/stability protein PilW [Shewanella submarina]
MKQGLPIVCALLLSGLTAGCVTERTYSGTDIQVQERKFDKVSAARERIQLGLTYLQRGNSEQAKYNLDRALSHAPDLEDAHIAMAYYYQTVGDLRRAESAYQGAVNTRNPSGDALNNFGVFLCQQEKYEQAEKMFLAAIDTQEYTRTGSSYENLGICSRKAGHIEKAKQYFESALKYEPRRASTMMELILLSLEQNDFSDARQELARYHRVVPESAQSLALGIKIEQGLNDPEAVKRYGIRLLAKFPASEQARQYRASLN